MDEIKEFFKESHEAFMIYVVEQRFVVGRGHEYFKSFQGKENFIQDNLTIKKRINKILSWLGKKIPDISDLIKDCFNINPIAGITDAVAALCKLFSVQEHQAAGPDVIDPILIKEE